MAKNVGMALMVILILGAVQAGCIFSFERANGCDKDWHVYDGHWYTCAWSQRD